MRKEQEEIQTGSFGGNPDGARVDFDAARDKAKLVSQKGQVGGANESLAGPHTEGESQDK